MQQEINLLSHPSSKTVYLCERIGMHWKFYLPIYHLPSTHLPFYLRYLLHALYSPCSPHLLYLRTLPRLPIRWLRPSARWSCVQTLPRLSATCRRPRSQVRQNCSLPPTSPLQPTAHYLLPPHCNLLLTTQGVLLHHRRMGRMGSLPEITSGTTPHPNLNPNQP